MAITAKQLKRRKNHIGSSDMLAVLGGDIYKSAFDVFLEKTGQLTEQKENKQMFAGTMFESGVLDYAEQMLGKLKRNQRRIAPDGLPIASNTDAMVVSDGSPVDAKTSGLFGPLNKDWGEPGTDEIPNYVIVQAQTHILCCRSDVCYIPAFLAGRGFQMFIVHYNERLIQMIREEAVKFWEYVKAVQPPPDTQPTMRAISRMIREPDKIINIPNEPVELWQKTKEIKKIAVLAEKIAQKKVLALLGDAEVGQSEAGTVTYKEQSRKEYTVKSTTFRVARLSNVKALPAALGLALGMD
ncbi:MAG: YqaJ viral recombinase family protein [Planctomycetota bacterium]